MDVLKEAACAYDEVSKYDYTFWLGNSKRKMTISILSTPIEMFTHISGLDHLQDIPQITAKDEKAKKAVFRNILNGKIGYSDIEPSKYLFESFSSDNETTFTINDRIKHIANIKKYLDNASEGSFQKWEKRRCQFRGCQINADYLLSVPLDKSDNTKRMYFFLKKSNRSSNSDRNTPLRLFIVSAFPDFSGLTLGQQRPFTILKLTKKNLKSKMEEVIFVHPKFQNQNDENHHYI